MRGRVEGRGGEARAGRRTGAGPDESAEARSHHLAEAVTRSFPKTKATSIHWCAGSPSEVSRWEMLASGLWLRNFLQAYPGFRVKAIIRRNTEGMW